MAEIKSTLDLVMERTRNLRLSDEEKETHRRENFLKKLNGLVQRFEEGQLRVEEIQREILRLQEAHAVSDIEIVIEGLAGRIDLEQDNPPALSLLRELCPGALEPLETVLQQYREARQDAGAKHTEIIRDRLLREHGISGSAVVPMVEADPAWHETATGLRDVFDRRLKQAIAELDAGSRGKEKGQRSEGGG